MNGLGKAAISRIKLNIDKWKESQIQFKNNIDDTSYTHIHELKNRMEEFIKISKFWTIADTSSPSNGQSNSTKTRRKSYWGDNKNRYIIKVDSH